LTDIVIFLILGVILKNYSSFIYKLLFATSLIGLSSNSHAGEDDEFAYTLAKSALVNSLESYGNYAKLQDSTFGDAEIAALSQPVKVLIDQTKSDNPFAKKYLASMDYELAVTDLTSKLFANFPREVQTQKQIAFFETVFSTQEMTHLLYPQYAPLVMDVSKKTSNPNKEEQTEPVDIKTRFNNATRNFANDIKTLVSRKDLQTPVKRLKAIPQSVLLSISEINESIKLKYDQALKYQSPFKIYIAQIADWVYPTFAVKKEREELEKRLLDNPLGLLQKPASANAIPFVNLNPKTVAQASKETKTAVANQRPAHINNDLVNATKNRARSTFTTPTGQKMVAYQVYGNGDCGLVAINVTFAQAKDLINKSTIADYPKESNIRHIHELIAEELNAREVQGNNESLSIEAIAAVAYLSGKNVRIYSCKVLGGEDPTKLFYGTKDCKLELVTAVDLPDSDRPTIDIIIATGQNDFSGHYGILAPRGLNSSIHEYGLYKEISAELTTAAIQRMEQYEPKEIEKQNFFNWKF